MNDCVFFFIFSYRIVGIENGDLDLTSYDFCQTGGNNKSQVVKGVYQGVIRRISHEI